MKKLQYLLLTILATLTFVSCTHNDGDIGIWFGTWQVENITCDDGTQPSIKLDGTLFFQFQSDIATIRQVTTMHDELVDYGSWTESDDKLDITFPDANVAYFHVLPTATDIHFATDSHYPFTIVQKSNKLVTLSIDDAANKQWTFTLRKQ